MTAPVAGSGSWPAWMARVLKPAHDADRRRRAAARGGPSRSCRVTTPAGLPSTCTTQRVGRAERGDRGAHRLARADDRQRRRHVLLDPVGEARPCRRTARRAASSRRPSRPPRRRSPAARRGRRASGRRRTRAGCRSPRGRSRSGACAPASGSRRPSRAAPRRPSRRAVDVEEAVVGHPLVVEDLAQVAAAAVGQQHDHDVVLGQLLGRPQRGDDGHAAGAADQQALLAGQPPGHREGVGVGDRDDLVGDRRGRRWPARSPRRRPRPGRAGRCRRSRPSPRGRRR